MSEFSEERIARAKELADAIRAIRHEGISVSKNTARQFDPVLSREDATMAILSAIAEAERRGQVAGLREAKEIASGQFGWDISVWADMTKKDMTRLMAEAIVAAITARIAEIDPQDKIYEALNAGQRRESNATQDKV